MLPFPPVGVLPFICDAEVPSQMVCALLVMVLFAITVFTVINTAAEVSVAVPASTYLLYQVFCVNAPGV